MNKIPFSVYDFFGYLASGFVLLATVDLVTGANWLFTRDIPVQVLFLLLVTVYIAGHLVAHLSSVLLELWFLRKVLGSPEVHMLNDCSGSRWSSVFPGNFKPLPADTRRRTIKRAEQEDVAATGRGLFLHCHATVKRDQATLERLNSFLNLYGFCRNISMAALVSTVLLVGAAIWKVPLCGIRSVKLEFLAVAFALLFVAVGMFIRYLKFFRHYTQEVFVSYASDFKSGEGLQ